MFASIKRKVIPAMLWPVLASRPAKNGVVAITFHNILQSQISWFDSVCRIVRERYNIIDPSEFQRGQYTYDSHDLQVLFTFDDGFLSNIKLARECMSKYEIKGLFFLTEEFIDKNVNDSYSFALDRFYPRRRSLPQPKKDYAAMSWSDVEWLLKDGHSIGAHTRTHPNLKYVPDELLIKDEVITSADRIEDRLGLELSSFAYPFGSISSVSKSVIASAMLRFSYGFSNVRGTVSESPSNHFLFRQNLVPNDPLWLVVAMIEGRLDWKHKKERDQSRRLVMDAGQ